MRRGTVKLRRADDSRNAAQSVTCRAIAEFSFDAAIGGARRDEEKARAKERVFSFRDEFGQWDPKNQRPELWSLYNTRVAKGEHTRVFPLSNWTELDVWQYIEREELEVPSIYYAHRRSVVRRGGMLVPVTDITPRREGETVEDLSVRFRTVGDAVHRACRTGPHARRDRRAETAQTVTEAARRAFRSDPESMSAQEAGIEMAFDKIEHQSPFAQTWASCASSPRSVDDAIVDQAPGTTRARVRCSVAAVARARRKMRHEGIDLSLSHRRPEAEREQGITSTSRTATATPRAPSSPTHRATSSTRAICSPPLPPPMPR